MKIFTVYDVKAEAYLQPIFLSTRGMCIRAIQECLMDEKHNFARYPGDYTLFEIGDWNECTGNLKMLEVKVNLGTCLELLGSIVPKAPLVSNVEVLNK